MPFRVVEALAARGAPDVALAVQRCRGAPPADLPQAQALLDVRLAEGLLTDAVIEVHWFAWSLTRHLSLSRCQILLSDSAWQVACSQML